MPGGGGGGGEFRRLSRIHLPRRMGEVFVVWDVSSRMLPWPSSQPRSGAAFKETRRKPGPITPGMPYSPASFSLR